MDAKSLQLRWTDIEIRKYRLHNQAEQDEEEKYNVELGNQREGDHDDDELPPLEENCQIQNKNGVSNEGNGSSDDE